jgi:hypothetical protein
MPSIRARARLAAIACLSLLAPADAPAQGADAAPPRPDYARRWVYVRPNLQVKESADAAIALIDRAAKAGYNGIVLADYKLWMLDQVPEFYFDNARRFLQAARRAKVEVIPTVFALGYSNGHLAHDPNLAEGVPVVDAPFAVRRGVAAPVGVGKDLLRNGGFETTTMRNLFANYNFQDGPGKATFADTAVAREGRTSLRIQPDPASPLRRISQGATVRPHTAYRLSAWVKTRDARGLGAFNLMAMGQPSGRVLSYFDPSVLAATQDWKRVDVVFNSLDNTGVNAYVGLWGEAPGTVWVDDFRLEEIGPINVLRRPGCPVRVASADGKTAYEEGRDFARLEDPKLGRVPWAGQYEYEHDAPPLRIPAGSRIKDGQALRVSWYHPLLIQGPFVMICPSERKTYEVLRDQLRRVDELFRPKAFFMSHDEIRTLNWCAACQARKATPGQILADNATRCVNLIRELRPDAEIVVWSDMFDPHHNAADGYYLVNGTLKGSWEGLPPEVTIANWNPSQPGASLRFFAGRGHRQVIAGYYDAPDLGNFQAWDAAATGVKGVDGFMYTTWQEQFGLVEAYGRAIRRQP